MSLVSCIMPTAGRPQFVTLAVRYFLRQTWPHKELIIIDDGSPAVESFLPEHPAIRYFNCLPGKSLGEKRNLACDLSKGAIILHWDDDDWMAPEWIRKQVCALEQSAAEVTGIARPWFYRPEDRRAWRYVYPEPEPDWVHGATLCYRKRLWKRNPFPAVNLGEDCQFLWSPVNKLVVPHLHEHLYIGIMHGKNTSQKSPHAPHWQSLPGELLEHRIGSDLPALRNAALATTHSLLTEPQDW